MAEHDAEIAAIARQSGRAELRQHHRGAGARRRARCRGSSDVFFALSGAHTNDAIQAIEREISPRLAAHYNKIYLNGDLFRRIEQRVPRSAIRST